MGRGWFGAFSPLFNLHCNIYLFKNIFLLCLVHAETPVPLHGWPTYPKCFPVWLQPLKNMLFLGKPNSSGIYSRSFNKQAYWKAYKIGSGWQYFSLLRCQFKYSTLHKRCTGLLSQATYNTGLIVQSLACQLRSKPSECNGTCLKVSVDRIAVPLHSNFQPICHSWNHGY